MRTSFCIAPILGWALSAAVTMHAQSAPKKSVSPAHLELTAEIATTTDEGYPSALRVSVKNAGSVVVSMPMLAGGCRPDNGVQIQVSWSTEDGQPGGGGAGACGITDQPTLVERVMTHWVRLQPGEFMTTMLRVVLPTDKPGAVITYRVEYTPPDASAREIEELHEAGRVIPTERLKTEPANFVIH